jgi:hypothetical protein
MIEISDDTVTMTVAEYDNLYDDSILLNCLRNAGVDNWDGWEYAVEAYEEIMNGEMDQ